MKTQDFSPILLSVLLLATQDASAATTSDFGALALGALVASHSPILNTSDTLLIRRLFNGHFYKLRGDTATISVTADAIVCSAGTVDYHSALMQADIWCQDGQPDWTRSTRALRHDGSGGSAVGRGSRYDVSELVTPSVHD